MHALKHFGFLFFPYVYLSVQPFPVVAPGAVVWSGLNEALVSDLRTVHTDTQLMLMSCMF